MTERDIFTDAEVPTLAPIGSTRCELTNRTGLNKPVSAELLDSHEASLTVLAPPRTAAQGHHVEIAIPCGSDTFQATARVVGVDKSGDRQTLQLALVQFEKAALETFVRTLSENQDRFATAYQEQALGQVPTESTEAESRIPEFLAQHYALVADPSRFSREALGRILKLMGAQESKLLLAPGFEAAIEMARSKAVAIVLSEFSLGDCNGLELCQHLKAQGAGTAVFSIVASHFCGPAVAQAIDQEIDCLITRPYSVEGIQSGLRRALASRISPDPYRAKVLKGQALLAEGKPKEAEEVLSDALSLNPKPVLAEYYLGKCFVAEKSFTQASKHFEQGLRLHKNSQRCLDGLLEVQIAENQFEAAYTTLQKMSRHFSLSIERLSTAFRLAVATQNYDDIERLYQKVLQSGDLVLDSSSQTTLGKHACAALLVCGKHYLKTGHLQRAREVLEKSVTAGQFKPSVLREAVPVFIEYGLKNDATGFLALFPEPLRNSIDYVVSEFLVLNAKLEPKAALSLGKKLVAQGWEDPDLYRAMLSTAQKARLEDEVAELTAALTSALAKIPPTN